MQISIGMNAYPWLAYQCQQENADNYHRIQLSTLIFPKRDQQGFVLRVGAMFDMNAETFMQIMEIVDANSRIKTQLSWALAEPFIQPQILTQPKVFQQFAILLRRGKTAIEWWKSFLCFEKFFQFFLILK